MTPRWCPTCGDTADWCPAWHATATTERTCVGQCGRRAAVNSDTCLPCHRAMAYDGPDIEPAEDYEPPWWP